MRALRLDRVLPPSLAIIALGTAAASFVLAADWHPVLKVVLALTFGFPPIVAIGFLWMFLRARRRHR